MSKRTDKEDIERELLMHIAEAGMCYILAKELKLNQRASIRVLRRTLIKAFGEIPELQAFVYELKLNLN